jgi:serine phosphatase RsbU (regulator of sigma subunit)
VAQEGGLPFGVQPEDREVAELELGSGAALVIVTDGLVERRGEDIDEGVERVLDVARSAGAMSARSLLSRIVAGASSDRIHDDDVTVLVLRRT